MGPSSAPIIGVMLAALPACLAARTAGEVAHFAMSYQDCTSTCSDAVACEVDGTSKFTEQVRARSRASVLHALTTGLTLYRWPKARPRPWAKQGPSPPHRITSPNGGRCARALARNASRSTWARRSTYHPARRPTRHSSPRCRQTRRPRLHLASPLPTLQVILLMAGHSSCGSSRRQFLRATPKTGCSQPSSRRTQRRGTQLCRAQPTWKEIAVRPQRRTL